MSEANQQDSVQDGKTGRRATIEQNRQNLVEVRRLLRQKLRTHEIARMMSCSERQVYRYFKQIREQDQAWLDELAHGEFVSAYRASIEFLQDRQRKCLEIESTEEDAYVRLKATELAASIEWDIQQVLAYGPTVLALRNRSKTSNIAEVVQ